MAPIGDTDSTQQDDSLASRRSKRAKKQTGANSALEKIRKFRETGERTKFEVGSVKDVYRVVDEEEYSDIVRQRQEEDWVVDDDGAGGYVEDGREIFDDDLDEEEVQKGPKHKPKKQNVKKPTVKAKTINKMFLAASAKSNKSEPEKASLGSDDFLDDILKEVENPRQPVKLPKSKTSVFRTPPGISTQKATPRRLQATGSQPRSSPFGIQRASLPPVKCKPKEGPEEKYGGLVGEPMEDVKEEADSGNDDMGFEDFGDDDALGDADALQALDEAEYDAKPIKVKEEKMDEMEISNPIPVKAVKREIDGGSAWETVLGQDQSKEHETYSDVAVDSSSLPLTEIDGEKFLQFYWFDAYEDRIKQPGVVYLFGKVKIESAGKYVSCCVTIKNIDRNIFILPREKRIGADGSESENSVGFKDVYEEFNEKIASKNKIMKFVCRKVEKSYAFDIEDIPTSSEYLEVRYSAEYPQLPSDLKGETFSHVFGTNTTSMELLLLNRKMKGPCWLNIKNPQLPGQQVSFCKVEAVVGKPDFIEVAPEQDNPPPLVVMSLSMKTLMNSRTHTQEVLAVSALVHQEVAVDKAAPKDKFQYRFCAVSKPSDKMYPFDFKDIIKKKHLKIDVMASERALLAFVVAKIHKIDPDVLVGHDIFGFDLDILLHRISACKIPQWSRIGRLKRSIMPKSYQGRGGHNVDPTVTCGRLLCDVKISSRELIRSKSYDLSELSRVVLQTPRQELDQDDIGNMYNTSQELLHLLELTTVDSLLTLRIMYELNVLPLAHQITTIAGNVLSRTLLGGRSERNEFLLLHAFHEKGYICPDKSYGKKQVAAPAGGEDDDDHVTTTKKGRRKPAYAGGLVLEPKKGFYDKFILLLDFNSLYPSIIQEYNICFTTIDRKSAKDEEDDIVDLPDMDQDPGILPTEIRKLVERRRQVKGMMKTVSRDSDKYLQYDIRQKALKLTANSMYGCLGFSHSRFYAKPLAALVTSKGREILMKTKDLVQQMHLDVIYGDTDSIMINTNSTDLQEVKKVGNKVKSEVNKLYRLLEIDIDGIFKSMLLLKKKKYAAIMITENEDGTMNEVKEMKGLDIVRRDWCDLAKDAGNYVLSQILSAQSREAIVDNVHDFLITIGEDVKGGKVDLQKYVINKQLTKAPHDYPDKKSLPHVHVALWLMSKSRKVGVGDTIPYVICDDGSTLPASQRAYHPDEFRKSDSLKIDTKYYLANQVHPVVARLCDPIDGTDSARIAECLGLDPSGYRHAATRHDDEADALLGGQAQMTDEERFKDCVRLVLKCKQPGCDQQTTIEELCKDASARTPLLSALCPGCEKLYSPATVINHLTVIIRKHIKEYYAGWQRCEDPSCDHRTRQVPLMHHRGTPTCPNCHRAHMLPVYSDTALYNQLLFYGRLFDADRALKTLKDNGGKDFLLKSYLKENKIVKSFYTDVHTALQRIIEANAYSEVDLAKLFKTFLS
ncbi:DNA polymerase alpha catalytic subunit [Nematostella vectensis]|uniref:DNA polymerase alpha catalytic subunit n=1 Tax=Nematostella vectensis TaxID=45351 RepID=UPI00207746EB|nr:DNA polymerase alpha catalytic subunit [Nematostella vectensis]